MLQLVQGRFFERMNAMVRHVRPVAPSEAVGTVNEVYRQLQRDFEITPPFTLHSPSPTVLAGAWSVVRESQIVPGQLGRPAKEAISAAVSQINACPYCVDAHTGLLTGVDQGVTGAAVRNGELGRIVDPRTRDLVAWASASRQPDDPALKSPPFSREEAPEAIGTALAFHYINRMVHVFLGEGLVPGPAPVRAAARRMFGATFARRIVQRGGAPGSSLGLLPAATATAELAWAAPNPAVAGAWARFSSVIDEIGNRAIPFEVQAMLEEQLAGWCGDDPGLSGPRMDEALSRIPDFDRPVARHVLLTALASYRISDTEVDALRRSLRTDAALVELTAWAAFNATRRIATWLAPN